MLFLAHFLSFFLFCLLQVDGIKLTLNQDLTELSKSLFPLEIGQFLHSIKDFQKLAECLDPGRSRINLDLLYFYNNYGCSDQRVFNWERISEIITGTDRNSSLSREDRLILLNRNCLMAWPGFLSPSNQNNISFLLDIYPELNPILEATDSVDSNFWSQCSEKMITLLLDKAQISSKHLNFIPSIEKLYDGEVIFSKKLISRQSLIGPNILTSCLLGARTNKRRKSCESLTFHIDYDFNKFTPRDLFYWSLNVSTVTKYSIEKKNVINLSRYFANLLSALPQIEAHLIIFISELRDIICNHDEINFKLIFKIFEYLCKNYNDSSDKDILDPLFIAVEFYKWIQFNEDIEGDFQNFKKISELLFKTIYESKNMNLSIYLLNFILTSEMPGFNRKGFEAFLKNNFDPTRPSIELLKVFSKGNASEIKRTRRALKSFLDLNFRLSFLRKLSFAHPESIETPKSIEIFISDDFLFSESFFEGIYDSILQNNLLVFPLEINVNSSSFLKEFLIGPNFKNLNLVLNKFWQFISNPLNGFFKSSLLWNDEGYQLTPYPWTHPNILFIIGHIMTLSILHGIKLKKSSLKRSIFNTAFTMMRYNDNLNTRDHFIKVYQDVNFTGNSFKQSVISEISNSYANLDVFLDNYQRNLEKGMKIFNSLNALDSIWISKIFLKISSSNFKGKLFNFLKEEPEFYGLERSSLKFFCNSLEYEDSDSYSQFSDSFDSDDQFLPKAQIYSLFSGLEPVTRFLSAKEAYNLIFEK